MDTVQVVWEDCRRKLEEAGSSKFWISWFHQAFDAGVDSYTLIGISADEVWRDFRKVLEEAVATWPQFRRYREDDEQRESLMFESRQAFDTGVDAAWMATASIEELKERRDWWVKQLKIAECRMRN